MRKVEIVVRGERGSGKTTALAIIVKKFNELGLNVSYEEPAPSARRAYNHSIDNFREEDLQPMSVHVREELTDGS